MQSTFPRFAASSLLIAKAFEVNGRDSNRLLWRSSNNEKVGMIDMRAHTHGERVSPKTSKKCRKHQTSDFGAGSE